MLKHITFAPKVKVSPESQTVVVTARGKFDLCIIEYLGKLTMGSEKIILPSFYCPELINLECSSIHTFPEANPIEHHGTSKTFFGLRCVELT